MKINVNTSKTNRPSNNVKIASATKSDYAKRFEAECLFSSANLKTKYFDINIDCATYDDTQWVFPLSNIYEVIRDKGYTNVVMVIPAFVAAERETSYGQSIYCDGSDFITGVAFSYIDYARSTIPFKSVDEMKDFIDEIVGTNLVYSRQSDRSLMDLSEFGVAKFIAVDGKKCTHNPMKRNILVLMDKEFGYTKENDGKGIAKKILDFVIKQDEDHLKEWVTAAWNTAYCQHLAIEALKKEQGLDFKNEAKKDLKTYSAKVTKYVEEKLGAEWNDVDGDPFIYVFNGQHKAPDGTPVETYIDKNYSLDDLVEARYLYDKKPSVYEYYSMSEPDDENFDPEEYYKSYIEDEREEIAEVENPKWDRFNIREFTPDKLAKLVEKHGYWTTVYFAVPSPEDVKLFQYPNKYMDYVEFRKAKKEAAKNSKQIEESRDELLELIAKLEPKNDSEIMLKARTFPSYDKVFTDYAWNHPEVLESEDNEMVGLYGKSMYDICMQSKDQAPEHPPIPPQLIPKYYDVSV